MKLVKEHIIIEKFTQEESDPVHDLGIGNKYALLKPGDIVESKKGISVGGAHDVLLRKIIFEKTSKHQFFNNLLKDVKGVVLKKEIIGNEILLYIAFFSDQQRLRQIQKLVLTNEDKVMKMIYKKYVVLYGKTDYKTWDKYLDIIK